MTVLDQPLHPAPLRLTIAADRTRAGLDGLRLEQLSTDRIYTSWLDPDDAPILAHENRHWTVAALSWAQGEAFLLTRDGEPIHALPTTGADVEVDPARPYQLRWEHGWWLFGVKP
ncbi:hypothetical protein AB0M43_37215 [Longispora sp. NPDC051575]|uniref:hypothetical protein n=1 Tax=Longispora sp. NPDC051575 TaxID=3154943 RepID=UPI003434FE7A